MTAERFRNLQFTLSVELGILFLLCGNFHPLGRFANIQIVAFWVVIFVFLPRRIDSVLYFGDADLC